MAELDAKGSAGAWRRSREQYKERQLEDAKSTVHFDRSLREIPQSFKREARKGEATAAAKKDVVIRALSPAAGLVRAGLKAKNALTKPAVKPKEKGPR